MELFNGSIMIVCILLVSNSRGCCVAAQSDQEAAGCNTPEIIIDPNWHIVQPNVFLGNQYSS